MRTSHATNEAATGNGGMSNGRARAERGRAESTGVVATWPLARTENERRGE